MNKIDLNQQGDRSVFNVPEGYFENLGAQLSNRIATMEAENDSTTSQVQPRKKGLVLTMTNMRPVLYMTAMFTLILFSVSMILKYNNTGQQKITAQESKTEQTIPTAEDYLINSVGTYAISQYYVDSQVTE